jgi:hypothetical protein
MRRPLEGARRITGNAASHAKYGVGPATDYGADSGEPIHAPFKGWVTRWWSDTGGYSVATTTDWVKFTIQHLSAYAGKSSGQVNEGDVIGYVGNTGSRTEGPHVHCWIILTKTGERISFEQYLVNQGWTTAALWSSVPGPDKSTSQTSGGDTEPIPEPPEGVDMPAVIKRTEGTPEWSLVWPSLAGPSKLERGYVVTTDPKRARWWERFYELGHGTADGFGRDEYVEAQAMARLDHAAWVAGQPTASAPFIDYAKLASLIKVPTAAENGAAARTAIVKS